MRDNLSRRVLFRLPPWRRINCLAKQTIDYYKYINCNNYIKKPKKGFYAKLKNTGRDGN